jgi:hypothetical protein
MFQTRIPELQGSSLHHELALLEDVLLQCHCDQGSGQVLKNVGEKPTAVAWSRRPLLGSRPPKLSRPVP